MNSYKNYLWQNGMFSYQISNTYLFFPYQTSFLISRLFHLLFITTSTYSLLEVFSLSLCLNPCRKTLSNAKRKEIEWQIRCIKKIISYHIQHLSYANSLPKLTILLQWIKITNCFTSMNESNQLFLWSNKCSITSDYYILLSILSLHSPLKD